MKYLLSLAFVLALIGCRKDQLSPELPSKLDGDASVLVGEWEWEWTAIWDDFFGIPEELYPAEVIVADSVNYSHSIRVYEEGKVDYFRDDVLEESYFVTIDYIEPDSFYIFNWVDFKLNLNNDPNKSFRGTLYLEEIVDTIKFLNGYPDPIIDPLQAGYYTCFHRKQ